MKGVFMKVLDIYSDKTTIQTFDDKKLNRVTPKIFMYSEAICKAENVKGAGIYWTINPQGAKNKRAIDLTTALSCIGMDCDVTKETDKKRGLVRLVEEEVQSLKTDMYNKLISLPIKPSGIIETRNGLQPYWVFTSPIILKPEERQKANFRYQDFIRGICKMSGLKSEGDNIQRVLRMPGYMQKKTDTDFLIKDIYEEGVKCKFDDFKNAYPPIVKETPVSKQQINTYSRLEDIPVQEALIKISGQDFVNDETYSFEQNSNGTIQIIVDGKRTGQWIDPVQNTIGGSGVGKGNPTIIQWVAWYFKERGDSNELAHAKTYQTLYPFLLPHVSESYWKKTNVSLANTKKIPELIIPPSSISHVAQMIVNPDYAKGIPTQYKEFDRITGGLKRQFTYGVVAASGQGKSLWAVNTLYNVAKQGYPVLYIDMENGEIMGERRLLQIHKNWTIRDMGLLTGQDTSIVEKALYDIEDNMKFYRIYDLGDLRGERKHVRVIRIIEKYVKENGVRVAVIDNINCFIPDGKLGDNEYKNEIYVAFDKLAVDHNISIIEIHHATDKLQKDMGYSKQDVENKKPKKFILPFLSKALGTSTFVEKIKVGMTLAMDEESGNIFFSVQKNRDGGNGFFFLEFDPETLRISNAKNNGFVHQEPKYEKTSDWSIDGEGFHQTGITTESQIEF